MKPRVLVFVSNNSMIQLLYHEAKIVWNSLELLFFFFNRTFLGLSSGPLDFFWVRV